MKSSQFPLPSMHYLLSFEASVRHMNFTEAATELKVTPSAVSKNISHLETYLGTKLFIRSKHGLNLTEQGELFYQTVTNSLQAIVTVIHEIHEVGAQSRGVKLVATRIDGGFFAHALLPRLHNFTEAQQGIRLILEEIDEVSSISTMDADIVYIHGKPEDWKNYHIWELCEEHIFPVCSPEYYENIDNSFSTDRLHTYNLIGTSASSSTFSWEDWLKTGRHLDANLSSPSIVLGYTLAIQAALAGEGIALAWIPDVAEQIRKGTLIKLGSRSVKTGDSYLIVAPKNRKLRPEVKAVVDWIISAVQGGFEVDS